MEMFFVFVHDEGQIKRAIALAPSMEDAVRLVALDYPDAHLLRVIPEAPLDPQTLRPR